MTTGLASPPAKSAYCEDRQQQVGYNTGFEFYISAMI